MKKTLLTAALLTAFGVAAIAPQASQAATASSGTITINGQVVTSTCNVNINGSGANPTVTLPTVDANSLATAGSSAGWSAVTIALSGCAPVSGVTKVVPYFFGANVDTSNGYLKNTTGGGSNVEIALSSTESLTGALALNGSVTPTTNTQNSTAQAPALTAIDAYHGLRPTRAHTTTANGTQSR